MFHHAKLIEFLVAAVVILATPAAAQVASTPLNPLGHDLVKESGKTYYVSTIGNNTLSGLSPAMAWRSISHAVDAASGSPVKPDDTVVVLPGTYREQVWFTKSGRAGSYITLKSITPRAAQLRPPANAYATVNAAGSYIAIVGFDVQGGLGHAISGANTSAGQPVRNHHVVISENRVHDSGGGGIEMAWGDYYDIEWNLAEHNCARDPGHTSGISIYQPHAADSAGGVHSVVRFNISRHNAEGATIRSHTDGNGFIIDDANATQASPGRSVPYAHATLIEENLAYGNGGKGIQIAWSNHVTVRNNTFYKDNQDNSNSGTWRGEISNNFSSHNTFVNNILVADTHANAHNTAIGDQTVPARWPTSDVKWIDNLTFNGAVGSPSIAIDGTHSTFSGTIAGKDPKFVEPTVDPNFANFRLRAGSPAIGSGDPEGMPPVDLSGRTRPATARPDLGAYLP